MRRAKQSPAISPQQLKHFAAAAVAATLLLALFATDEDWGAQAQIEANAAKTQLAVTEAEKLGTGKLANKLKVQSNTGGGFGNDEGGGGDVVNGGWGRQIPRSDPDINAPRQRVNGIPQLEQRAGASVTVKATDIDDVTQPDPAKRKKQRPGAFMPTAAQKQQIQDVSRQRTGSSSASTE